MIKNAFENREKNIKLQILGFTLIELLAVIVILAIIALIATPIVLNIITSAKESATLRSAENYLDAVENSIALSKFNNINITSGTYKIMKDGNICLDTLLDDTCTGDILKVEVSGESPTSGSIIINGSSISSLSLVYGEKTIIKNDKGKLVFLENKFKLGEEVVFDPGDGKRTWNVIGEDDETVTLILSENLGDIVEWMSLNDYYGTDTFTETVFVKSNRGPVTALTYLNTLTTNWTNVEPIEYYEFINNKNGQENEYGYQKLSIVNGVSTITNLDGTTTVISGETKARLSSNQELSEIMYDMIFQLNKEENLRAYIERNLEEIKTKLEEEFLEIELDLKATTVDELIEELKTKKLLSNELPIRIIYYELVVNAIELGIESDYNLSVPEWWMYANLDEDENTNIPEGYWLIDTSEEGDAGFADSSRLNLSSVIQSWTSLVWYSSEFGVTAPSKFGIRPVITILKSNI